VRYNDKVLHAVMIIEYDQPVQKRAKLILQEAGYHEFVDPNTHKVSYVLRLGREFYPRFHVYITKDINGDLEYDLHIDQKKASYEGSRAHSGEYDGAIVQEEAERLLRWLNHYTA